METTTLETHIVSTPDVLGGKPRIAGHRISVAHVATWHEWMGMSVDEIAAGYMLSLGEVYAALAYYFDHKAAIDQEIRDEEAFAEDLRRKATSGILAKCHNR
jgi:uncharacterized protein (DUF433 family)